MNKLIYIAVVIIVIFVGDRLLSYTISKVVLKSGSNLSTVYRKGQTNSIVLLGNSRGDNSFSPIDIAKSTGLKTFQLSHKGISMEIAECLWTDYLANNSAPEILILEITGVSSNSDAIYALKPYMYWSQCFSDLVKKKSKTAWLATRVSNLYIWNGEVLFSSIYYIGKTDQDRIKYNTKRLNSEISTILISKLSDDRRKMAVIQPNLDALYRMVDLANKRGVSVHLIFPPHAPQYAKLINESKNTILSLISNHIGDTAELHDMSNDITEIGLFSDLTHVNYDGSKLLLKMLLGKNILPKKIK